MKIFSFLFVLPNISFEIFFLIFQVIKKSDLSCESPIIFYLKSNLVICLILKMYLFSQTEIRFTTIFLSRLLQLLSTKVQKIKQRVNKYPFGR